MGLSHSQFRSLLSGLHPVLNRAVDDYPSGWGSGELLNVVCYEQPLWLLS